MGSREERFKALHKTVRQVLFAFDPTGLFELGAPLDECDWAVARIISVLEELDGPSMLPERLEKVFEELLEMNPNLSTKNLGEISIPIWEAWEEFSRSK